MMVLNSRYWWWLAAVASITGCGKQERMEAVQFAKALRGTTANFSSANTIEKDFVSNARAWCGGITANGAGRGIELDQNAAVAAELAKYTLAVSSQLSQVRQAIDRQLLKEEYPREVRDDLTTQLTKRQRSLQNMRAVLEQSATEFQQLRHTTYAADTYPDGVGKLDALLRGYIPPDDAVGTALAALREKYGLSDSEI
jgi:phage terminase large subunit GpA-like protein